LLAGEVSAQRSERAAVLADQDAGGPPDRGTGDFPLPPMDLPHYRGIGVITEQRDDRAGARSVGPATVADTAKEVTGA